MVAAILGYILPRALAPADVFATLVLYRGPNAAGDPW